MAFIELICLLFRTTTEPIVIQKNDPGHWDESVMANATVTIKTITSIMMLHTIRGVALPLQNKSTTYNSINN